MDSRTVDHEDNEIVDGHDQIFSPFLSDENSENHEKRMNFLFFNNAFVAHPIEFRIEMESSTRSR